MASGKVESAQSTDIGRYVIDPTLAIDLTLVRPNYLTSDQGVKASDTDNWLKISDGTHVGLQLLEDQLAREKVMHFDHERIPERVVHARGTGAYGYFKVYDDRASKYTYAPVLTDPSRTTIVFVRFSTVQGSRGSADTVRDVRGFAKFYTEEGNWDLVGNDTPVFFIQESDKSPDFVHAVKPEPHDENVKSPLLLKTPFFKTYFVLPAANMVMWVMSDRGIPRSFRMMQGFGVNTYILHTLNGEQFFVKFHWIPELGVHSLVWDEALKISGQDTDFHRKDLYEAIENGAFPKWKFCIQVIPTSKEHDFDFDILDATPKYGPKNPCPLKKSGIGFCTANVVPGIGFSDDPLLQGRNFSSLDTQLSRLGVNWQEFPVNQPVCPIYNHQRDGQMRHRITYTKVLNCIDFKLAKEVATNVGSIVPDKPGRENHGKTSKSLSQFYYAPKVPTVVERRVAILVADGFNLEEVRVVHNALSSVPKARTFIIGPRRGEVYLSGAERAVGKGIKADHHFEGRRSTLFDAVYIPSGDRIDELAKSGRAVQYVKEAFGHCKAIGAVGTAIGFLQNIVDLPGVEFQHENSANVKSSFGATTTSKLDSKAAATDPLQIIDDYSHRFFIWHEWIQANGPLTAQNVFDYFASSMFYDKQSNNQMLRMQTMHTGVPISNEAEELKRFVGVEFAVVHAQPPSLFIIHKRERISPEETRALQAYFIINNRIYQSPDMYTLTSLYSLESSLDILRKYKPDYAPRTGFAWPITETERPGEAAQKKPTDDPQAQAASLPDADPDLIKKLEKEKALTHPKKQQNTVLLLNAMRTTAAHPFQPFHEKAAAAAASATATAGAPSEAGAGEGRRSSETQASAPIPSQSAGSQSSGPSASQDSAKGAPAAATTVKRKKKRTSHVSSNTATSPG
ncbi:catalase-like domain-containing protein [Lactifluus subvellereus]|nr:catalase-like domain-containing protein [Lactifluus subvellereus]